MRQLLPITAIVLLVFAHHQGACWDETVDEPYSAVRHLSTSRDFGDADSAFQDSRKDSHEATKPSRQLFSWDLETIAAASSTPLSLLQNFNSSTDNSDVFDRKRQRKERKMRNKKKKKRKETLRERDEISSWESSVTSSSIIKLTSAGSDEMLTVGERRRKHKNKARKNKWRMEDEYEGIVKKRRKANKSKEERDHRSDKESDEKLKKDKKRKKDKKLQKEKKRKEEELSMSNIPLASHLEISAKSRSKFKLKDDTINPELLPSSSESNLDIGKYRKRERDRFISMEKNNDNSLETLKNDINVNQLPDKLTPTLYYPKVKEPTIPVQESPEDNKLPQEIPLTEEKGKSENNRNSSTEVKEENIIIPLKRKNHYSSTPLSTMVNHNITIKPLAKEKVTALPYDNSKRDSSSGKDIKPHTSFKPDIMTESIEDGDLSCLSGTFLAAPPVDNAEIKYTRGKFLEAEYECLPGYKMMPDDTSNLACKNRTWIGELPQCLPDDNNSITKSVSYETESIRNNTSCGKNRGGCEQLCNLVNGKPICSCFRGFILQGKQCLDLNECATSNGGCEVSCHNLPGSYHCGCPSGFRLAANGKTCLDINECLLRNGHGPCQDSCYNLPGGYTCSCEGIEGTRLATDNHTCQDLDECARNNAGCSHTCLNTLGRAFCLCPSGFMLGTDWKTCHDIDECADPELQEGERCIIGCVNTLGSYHCVELRDQAPDDYPSTTAEPTSSNLPVTSPPVITTASSVPIECLPGFEVGPFGSCKDIDECLTDNGGCSHTCKNTLGSAFCLCPSGFMLTNDWKTCKAMELRTTAKPKLPVVCSAGHVVTSGGRCKDIDECAIQNGGCMHGCVNIKGSFRCICGRGFYLAADGKTCVEERVDIVCPPLPTPNYGYLHCTRRVFMVAPERWRARWRRRIVNHAGAVCELRCPHGYKVHGEYRKVCESSGIWAGPEDGYCIPFPKPKIECPRNISMEIEPWEKTAFVAFPQPITDVDWFRNVISKPSWGKDLERDLPIGNHSVTFIARHPISRHTASCTLHIMIRPALPTKVPEELA